MPLWQLVAPTSAAVASGMPRNVSAKQWVKVRARRALGIERLNARIDQLEERLQMSREETHDLATTRWRNAAPEVGLTWGAGAVG